MGSGPGSGIGKKKAGVLHVRNMRELQDYMSSHYGVELDNKARKMDFEVIQDMSAGIEQMLNEFPELKGQVNVLSGNMKGDNAYAGTGLDGAVQLHAGVLRNMEAAQEKYNSDVNKGFHPEGTGTRNIVVHEMGHQLEALLLSRKYPGKDAVSQTQLRRDWRDCKMAAEIVGKAMNKVDPNWRQSPRKAEQMIRDISGYATSDASETMAEAISDYFSNRSRAKPLSKAIWRTTREEIAKGS